MITIYDVARRAGVSPSTVSRVFSGSARVAPQRVQAVRAAAEELGFVPNRNAQRLRTTTSTIIAMMVPDIANPFFTLLTRAVEDVARAAGYSVMLCNTDEDPQRELDYLKVAAAEPVAGIITIPNAWSRLDWAIERGVPLVCLDRPAPHHQVDAVVVNNEQAAAEATRRLVGAGYTRLGCVTGPTGVATADQRLAGWAQVVAETTGAPPPAELIRRADYTLEAAGEQAASQLLDLAEPPDAIFAANNRLATGTLRALARRDRLPPQVGVVSFGGPPQVLLSLPGLITTYLPTRAMGTRAAQMLLERIDGLATPARSITLPVGTEPQD